MGWDEAISSIWLEIFSWVLKTSRRKLLLSNPKCLFSVPKSKCYKESLQLKCFSLHTCWSFPVLSILKFTSTVASFQRWTQKGQSLTHSISRHNSTLTKRTFQTRSHLGWCQDCVFQRKGTKHNRVPNERSPCFKKTSIGASQIISRTDLANGHP